MKKIGLWMCIAAMCFSLCACRPEMEGESAASEGAPATEAVADDPEQSETDAEPREEEVQPEDTEVEENEDSEIEEQPAEDPDLRAQANRIYAEKGEQEYYLFCGEQQIKYYNKFTLREDLEWDLDWIRVELYRGAATPGDPAPDFSCIDPITVIDLNSKTWIDFHSQEEWDQFIQAFYVQINAKSKEEVKEAIKKLEQLDYVQAAMQQFIYDPFDE